MTLTRAEQNRVNKRVKIWAKEIRKRIAAGEKSPEVVREYLHAALIFVARTKIYFDLEGETDDTDGKLPPTRL